MAAEGKRNRRPRKARREGTAVIFDPKPEKGVRGCRPGGPVVSEGARAEPGEKVVGIGAQSSELARSLEGQLRLESCMSARRVTCDRMGLPCACPHGIHTTSVQAPDGTSITESLWHTCPLLEGVPRR